MQWNDDAIILSSRPYSENSLVVTLLSIERGLHSGMVRGAKKNAAMIQPGNHVCAVWKSRLEEQLGTFQIESKKNYASLILDDPLKLSAMTSLCSLLCRTLPERDPHPQLFEHMLVFLTDLVEASKEDFLSDYITLELLILSNLGFGLDLSECVAGGSAQNLTYVSPKSGCSVSHEHGLAYDTKLLKLPSFLRPETDLTSKEKAGDMREIIDGITLTNYFLEKYIFTQDYAHMPPARERFINRIQKLGSNKDDT